MKKMLLSLVAVSVAFQPVCMVAAPRSSTVVVAGETRSTGFSRVRFLYKKVKELPEAAFTVAFSKQESMDDLKNTFSSTQRQKVSRTSIIPGIKKLVVLITGQAVEFAKSSDKTRTVSIRLEMSDRADHAVIECTFVKNAAAKNAPISVEVTTFGLSPKMPDYLLNMLKAILLDDSWMQKHGMTCVGSVVFLLAGGIIGGVVVKNTRQSTQKELTGFDGFAQKFACEKAKPVESPVARGPVDGEESLEGGVGIDLKDETFLGPVEVTQLAYTDALKDKKVVAATVFFPGQLEKLAPSLRWEFNQFQERYLFVPRQLVTSGEAFNALAKHLNYGRWHLVIVDLDKNSKATFEVDNFSDFHAISFAYLNKNCADSGHSDRTARMDFYGKRVSQDGLGFSQSVPYLFNLDLHESLTSLLSLTESNIDDFISTLSAVLGGRYCACPFPEGDCPAVKVSYAILEILSWDFRPIFFCGFDEAFIDTCPEKFKGVVCVDLADTVAVEAIKRNVTKFKYAVLLFFDSRDQAITAENAGMPGGRGVQDNTVLTEMFNAGFKHCAVSGPVWLKYSSTNKPEKFNDLYYVKPHQTNGIAVRDSTYWHSFSDVFSPMLQRLAQAERKDGFRSRDVTWPGVATERVHGAAYSSGGATYAGRRTASSVVGSGFGAMPHFNKNAFYQAVKAVGKKLDAGFVVTSTDGYFKLDSTPTDGCYVGWKEESRVTDILAFAKIDIYQSLEDFDARYGSSCAENLPTIVVILPEEVGGKVKFKQFNAQHFSRRAANQKRIFDAMTDSVLSEAVDVGYATEEAFF